jgi:hypothetical protein
LLSKETNGTAVSKRVPKTVAKKFRAMVRGSVQSGKRGLIALKNTSKAIYAKPKKYKKLLGSTGLAAVVTAAVVASK